MSRSKSQVPAELKSLLRSWYHLVPGDVVYQVKGTGFREHTIKSIKKFNNRVEIEFNYAHFIKIYDDKIQFYQDKWGNGKEDKTENYFINKFRAERQLNKNIDKRIKKLYEALEDCRNEIKLLKNKYAC